MGYASEYVIIIRNGKQLLSPIRQYIGRYMARDSLGVITRDYFGKRICPGILTFESPERARLYGETEAKYNSLFSNFKVCEYDACLNNIYTSKEAR